MSEEIRPYFWKKYSLNQLNRTEWEALCDGCGLCCLIKFEDPDSSDVTYTNVACKLLNTQTAACSNYAGRHAFVPDCIELDYEKLQTIHWLPASCAYRRLNESKPLPSWHHLITGSRQSVIKAKKSAAKRCVSEEQVTEEQFEQHIIRWVKH